MMSYVFICFHMCFYVFIILLVVPVSLFQGGLAFRSTRTFLQLKLLERNTDASSAWEGVRLGLHFMFAGLYVLGLVCAF